VITGLLLLAALWQSVQAVLGLHGAMGGQQSHGID